MNIIKKIKTILFSLLFFIFALPSVSATGISGAFNKPLKDIAGQEGAGYDDTATIDTVIGLIIQTAISVVGVIFLVLMIYGGYLWMTDRGNSDTVEKAKKLITAAIIGLIIVIGAYAITYFVIAKLTENTLS